MQGFRSWSCTSPTCPELASLKNQRKEKVRSVSFERPLIDYRVPSLLPIVMLGSGQVAFLFLGVDTEIKALESSLTLRKQKSISYICW